MNSESILAGNAPARHGRPESGADGRPSSQEASSISGADPNEAMFVQPSGHPLTLGSIASIRHTHESPRNLRLWPPLRSCQHASGHARTLSRIVAGWRTTRIQPAGPRAPRFCVCPLGCAPVSSEARASSSFRLRPRFAKPHTRMKLLRRGQAAGMRTFLLGANPACLLTMRARTGGVPLCAHAQHSGGQWKFFQKC